MPRFLTALATSNWLARRAGVARVISSLRQVSEGIPIFYQHRVSTVRRELDPTRISPAAFDEFLAVLARNGFQSIAIEQAVAWYRDGATVPPRSFALVFDDGYMDNWETALPIMRKYGFTAAVCVVPSLVGETRYFSYRVKPPGYIAPERVANSEGVLELRFMGWSELKSLVESGFSICAHSMTHRALTELGLDEARHEMVESGRVIESRLGYQPKVFCYPLGLHSHALEGVAQAAGYRAALSIEMGISRRDAGELYRLRRLWLSGNPWHLLGQVSPARVSRS